MAAIREVLEVVDRATAPLRRIGTEFSRTSQKAANLGSTVTRTVATVATLATVKATLNLSDQLALTEARLNNVNDGLQTTAELQRMIFDSAQRARGNYQQMAQTVANLKAQTGDTFSSIRETVAFTELLNKQFKIAGTDATQISSVMYNLTQALATGVLRGQDLNIVMSNAPQIAQRIARYMGVSVGELRKMAEQGQITSDVVKNAIMGSAEDIENQFQKIPATFSDSMQKLKNVGLWLFRPIGEMINRGINSKGFEQAMNGIATGIAYAANLAQRGFNLIGRGIEFVRNNMSTFGPIIAGAAAGMLFYAASTGAAAVASALLANPLVLIGALLGFIVGYLHNVADTGHTVFGDLAGSALGAYEAMMNGIKIAGNFILSVAEGIANGWNNTIFTIKNAFWNFVQATVNGVNVLVDALNKIPGINIGAVSNPLDMPDQKERVQFERFETTSMADAFRSGYAKGADWGDQKQNAVMDEFADLNKNVTELMGGGSFGDFMAAMEANKPLGAGDKVNVGSVDKVKDVKLSDEDVALYRDLAERRYMNNIELKTLAPNISVKVDGAEARNLSAQDIADKLKALLIEQQAAHTAVAHG